MEKLIRDVGQNGSAARGDATAGYQDKETREELPEIRTGGEFGEFGKEFRGEVGGVTRARREGDGDAGQTEMMRAETGLGFQAGLTAALAIGETVQAAERLVLRRDGSAFQGGASACGVGNAHDFPFFAGGTHTPRHFVWLSKQRAY